MAITYKWLISSMEAYVEAEGEDNVIFMVNWAYVAEDGTYNAITSGMQDYTYTEGDPFVPYSDTEAFEDVVISWLEGSLDVPAMQASIAANIESQITPVNEDLYFTWQNPVPPTPPPTPEPPIEEEEAAEEEAE